VTDVVDKEESYHLPLNIKTTLHYKPDIIYHLNIKPGKILPYIPARLWKISKDFYSGI